MPDVWLDETAEGNVFAALRMREADLEKHLGGADEKKDEAREKAREEARKKLEELSAKTKEAPKPLPEFGSAEDFPLVQALNQLKGKPVAVSKDAERAQGRGRPRQALTQPRCAEQPAPAGFFAPVRPPCSTGRGGGAERVGAADCAFWLVSDAPPRQSGRNDGERMKRIATSTFFCCRAPWRSPAR